MPITLNGDTGITTPTYGGADTAEYLVPVTAFKNRIINGAMVIDQRNAGAAVTNSNVANNFPVDRTFIYGSVSSSFTAQQSSIAPAGFTRSVVCTSSAATSLGASDYYQIAQNIEGFNVADLGWGTANAQTVTLSFWVRSSLTGTFGGVIGGINTRSYPFTYTISSANTFEYKTITIPGDTSGTWGTTNSYGITVSFSLGTGSTFSGTAGAWSGSTLLSATGATSVVGTNGANFYLTGIQLEKGSTATSFDYRPYGTELQLCQRYYYKNICTTGGDTPTPLSPMGWAYATTAVYVPVVFPQPMRSTPTLSRNGCQAYNPLVGPTSLTGMNLFDASNISANIQTVSASGITINYGYWISPSTVATSFIAFSAEL